MGGGPWLYFKQSISPARAPAGDEDKEGETVKAEVETEEQRKARSLKTIDFVLRNRNKPYTLFGANPASITASEEFQYKVDISFRNLYSGCDPSELSGADQDRAKEARNVLEAWYWLFSVSADPMEFAKIFPVDPRKTVKENRRAIDEVFSRYQILNPETNTAISDPYLRSQMEALYPRVKATYESFNEAAYLGARLREARQSRVPQDSWISRKAHGAWHIVGKRTPMFYAVVTAHTLARCRIDKDPLACNRALDSLKDINSYIGFAFFEYFAGKTNSVVASGLSLVNRMAPKSAIATRFIQRYVSGYIGMAIGSIANETYSELVADPHLQKSLSKIGHAIKNITGDDPTDWDEIDAEVGRLMDATLMNPEWWFKKRGRALKHLLSAAALSGGVQAAVNKGWQSKYGKWKYGQIRARLRGLTPGMGSLSCCDLPQLRSSYRPDYSFSPGALARNLGSRALKYSISTIVFLEMSHLTEGYFATDDKQLDLADGLAQAYYELDQAFLRYQELPDTLNLAHVADAIRDYQIALHAYRSGYLHKVDKIRESYMGLLSSIMGDNDKTATMYQWLAEGLPEEGHTFEQLVSQFYPNAEDPIDSLREDAPKYAKAFFCGPFGPDAIKTSEKLGKSWGLDKLVSIRIPYGVESEWLPSAAPRVVPYRVMENKDLCAQDNEQAFMDELAKTGDDGAPYYKVTIHKTKEFMMNLILPKMAEYTDTYVELIRKETLKALNPGEEATEITSIEPSEPVKFLPPKINISNAFVASFGDELDFWNEVQKLANQAGLSGVAKQLDSAEMLVHLFQFQAKKYEVYIADPKNFRLESKLGSTDPETMLNQDLASNWLIERVMLVPGGKTENEGAGSLISTFMAGKGVQEESE